MKWFNHMAVAGCVAAVVNPATVPAAVLGSTAPDWLERVLKAMGREVRHRTVTHVLASWVTGAVFFGAVADWRGQGLAFCLGACCHWLQDSLTITGVPLSWASDRRVTLAGGRFRTGGVGEYILSALVVALAAGFLMVRGPSAGYMPFFRDWPGLYKSGVVDGAEWRAHRFEFF